MVHMSLIKRIDKAFKAYAQGDKDSSAAEHAPEQIRAAKIINTFVIQTHQQLKRRSIDKLTAAQYTVKKNQPSEKLMKHDHE